jgi:hypothetical protein
MTVAPPQTSPTPLPQLSVSRAAQLLVPCASRGNVPGLRGALGTVVCVLRTQEVPMI